MSPTEWTAISTVAGALIGCGAVWGAAQATLRSLKTSHASLRDDFIRHKDDRNIHVDPTRDRANDEMLREFIAEKFATVHKRLDIIDARCEHRGEDCARHFAMVERRVSAISGKPNGE